MINITAKNFTLTKGIKDKVNEKLSKIEKFTKEEDLIDVVLDSNENRKKIGVFFKLDNKHYKAEEKDEDLYKAVDLVMDKIEKQIRRHLDKNIPKGKTTLRYGEYASPTKISEETFENEKPKIVKRKMFFQKPMFEEEAIEHMELLNHRSYIFFNADTDSMCMLYKRNDGDYGIIETEQ